MGNRGWNVEMLKWKHSNKVVDWTLEKIKKSLLHSNKYLS